MAITFFTKLARSGMRRTDFVAETRSNELQFGIGTIRNPARRMPEDGFTNRVRSPKRRGRRH
jgi:hypothetical protein